MGFSQKHIQVAKNSVGDNMDQMLEYLLNFPEEPIEMQSQVFNSRPMLPPSNPQKEITIPQLSKQQSQGDYEFGRQYSEIRIKKSQSIQQQQVQQNQVQWKPENASEEKKSLKVSNQQSPQQQFNEQKSQIAQQIPPKQQWEPLEQKQLKINNDARIPAIPVGITYKQPLMEPYVLLLFQNPLIVNLIMRHDQEQEEDDNFREELKDIISQLLVSQERMVSGEQLILAFEKARKFKMSDVTFQFILKHLDYYFKVDINQQGVKFQNHMIQRQFCGLNGKGFFEVLQVDAKEEYLHNSLWKLHSKIPIQEIPPNFNIIISREGSQRFGFPKVLEKDFSKFKDFVTSYEHKNYTELSLRIEDLKIVLAHLDEQPFVLEDTITLLTDELQELKDEVIQYPKAIGQPQYYLQAIINRSKELYTYNFSEQQWYKYTATIVIPIKEEDVLFDGYYNAIQVTYIDEQQRQIVMDFEKYRRKVANRVHVSQDLEQFED